MLHFALYSMLTKIQLCDARFDSLWGKFDFTHVFSKKSAFSPGLDHPGLRTIATEYPN